MGLKKIQSAKERVAIAGRDCSWLDHPSVRDALRNVAKQNVKVVIKASNPGRSTMTAAKDIGAKLKRTGVPPPAFCLIDNSMLLLPYRVQHPDSIQPEYELFTTTSSYLIEGFTKLFENLPASSNYKENT